MLRREVRGREVSRLEGFSDAIFGFVLTLLVVSLEVPQNYADLQRILVGFPAFAVTFAVICWVWYEHYLLFRRYDLEDGFTVLLNCVLLFIVVFYAYPMKFIFTRLITGTLFGFGPNIGEGLTASEARQLMIVYSGGFATLFATFMLLHWNAVRHRETLEMTELEVFDARASVRRHSISVTVGVLSVLMAWLLPIQYLALAGLLFFLMGPAHGVFGYVNGRTRKRVMGRLSE